MRGITKRVSDLIRNASVKCIVRMLLDRLYLYYPFVFNILNNFQIIRRVNEIEFSFIEKE